MFRTKKHTLTLCSKKPHYHLSNLLAPSRRRLPDKLQKTNMPNVEEMSQKISKEMEKNPKPFFSTRLFKKDSESKLYYLPMYVQWSTLYFMSPYFGIGIKELAESENRKLLNGEMKNTESAIGALSLVTSISRKLVSIFSKDIVNTGCIPYYLTLKMHQLCDGMQCHCSTLFST